MLEPPTPAMRAQFRPDFGQRILLTVDTEEEFDWNAPFSKNDFGLRHVLRIQKFQEFCEGLKISPVYLVDWPIATSQMAVDILRSAVDRGKAEIGIQLHPWVNPPKDEEINVFNSFAGNLPQELEKKKFKKLRDEIELRFGTPPLIYRAGRYGLGPNTSSLLQDAGVAIDTSVRANFDYSEHSGPDYSRHPLHPYWVDKDKQILELPLTSVFWGMLRKQGQFAFPLARRAPRLRGLFARAGLLERISLTPEGVTAEEAIRGIDMAVDDGLPVMVMSFHSPSLEPGHTPYVLSEDDLDEFYDWFRRIYAYCETLGVKPTTVAEIMKNVVR